MLRHWPGDHSEHTSGLHFLHQVPLSSYEIPNLREEFKLVGIDGHCHVIGSTAIFHRFYFPDIDIVLFHFKIFMYNPTRNCGLFREAQIFAFKIKIRPWRGLIV